MSDTLSPFLTPSAEPEQLQCLGCEQGLYRFPHSSEYLAITSESKENCTGVQVAE